MRRKIFKGVAAVAVTLLCLTVLAAVGNDYRFRLRVVRVPVPGGSLSAVLSLPAEPPTGLVVVVHGDGPVDATHDGLYSPWFEAAADAGFATLSWSKPGIGGSTGNWLHQSMTDRAVEVGHVLDWAGRRADLTRGPVVVWGASQAGWVLPKVVRDRTDVDAVVAVSPAVNWLRQGRFNLLSELAHDQADTATRQRATTTSDQTLTLLEQGADHATYLARTSDPTPVDADRWGFVQRNHRSDATADWRAAAGRHLPVLLQLGEHDRNVDVAETEATYRRLLGQDVSVVHLPAAHSMARPAVEDHAALGYLTAVLWPRALLAPGVLDSYRRFLHDVAKNPRTAQDTRSLPPAQRFPTEPPGSTPPRATAAATRGTSTSPGFRSST